MASHHRKIGLQLLLGGSALLWCSAPALAQQAPAADGEHDAAGDIVVTAQRTEQKLQNVPIAVTAITGADLAKRGVTDVATLQSAVPSLNVGPSPAGGSGAGAQIFIRGVGQLDYSATQEPDVPIYLDGVYLARPFGAVFDFLDLNRVEVLRGPQGTLFGRNALGGAVQVVTNLPDQDFGGRIKATVGSYERRDIEGVVNIPLSSTLAFRGAASSTNTDGYGRLLPTNTRTNDNRNTFMRGSLRWRPDDRTDVVVRGERYTHRDSMGLQSLLSVTPTAILNAYNTMLTAQGLPNITSAITPTRRYDGLSSVRRPEWAKSWGISLDASRDLGGATLKSITAYRTLDANTAYDFAPAIYPLINTETETREHQFSQELQISGETLDGRLRYVGGLYYFNERNKQTQTVFQRLNVVRTGTGPYDFAWVTNSGTVANTLNDQTTDSYAVYGQLGFELLPGLTASAGLRASWDKKALTSSAGTFESETNLRGIGTVSKTWNQVTPRFGLDYQVTPDILLYATVANGFRAGGFNGRVTTATPPLSYDAEKLWDYEGGIKTMLLDRRLRLNLSGFYYDYLNYQASTNQIVNGVVTVVVDNAASLRIYGFEAETDFRVNDVLSIGGFAAILRPKFHDIVPNTAAIRADSQPPNAPKFTAGANVQVRVPVGEWGHVTLRGDYSYKSKTEFFLPNLPGEAQKAYSLVNARIVLTPEDEQYEIALFGTNIFNTKYRTYGQSLASSYGVVTGVYGAPSQWGASLTVNF
jgi:iron complex outermembrane receptor protein